MPNGCRCEEQSGPCIAEKKRILPFLFPLTKSLIMARIVIVHDVLGTLFGLDAPIDEVLSIFREQLLDASSNDKGHARMFAELVVMVR